MVALLVDLLREDGDPLGHGGVHHPFKVLPDIVVQRVFGKVQLVGELGLAPQLDADPVLIDDVHIQPVGEVDAGDVLKAGGLDGLHQVAEHRQRLVVLLGDGLAELGALDGDAVYHQPGAGRGAGAELQHPPGIADQHIAAVLLEEGPEGRGLGDLDGEGGGQGPAQLHRLDVGIGAGQHVGDPAVVHPEEVLPGGDAGGGDELLGGVVLRALHPDGLDLKEHRQREDQPHRHRNGGEHQVVEQVAAPAAAPFFRRRPLLRGAHGLFPLFHTARSL